jgi:hypothetical protein
MLRSVCLTLLALGAGVGTAGAMAACGRGGGTVDVAEVEDVHVRMTEFALPASDAEPIDGTVAMAMAVEAAVTKPAPVELLGFL